MDIHGYDEIMSEVDREIAEDEWDELKEEFKDKRLKLRGRFKRVKELIQTVKCFFGSHLTVYDAVDDQTLCIHCKRLWKGYRE